MSSQHVEDFEDLPPWDCRGGDHLDLNLDGDEDLTRLDMSKEYVDDT